MTCWPQIDTDGHRLAQMRYRGSLRRALGDQMAAPTTTTRGRSVGEGMVARTTRENVR